MCSEPRLTHDLHEPIEVAGRRGLRRKGAGQFTMMTSRERLEATGIAGGREGDFAPNRYERMSYRRCGNSGLILPALALGSWQTFGGYRGPEVARRCLRRAFDLGITHFDFANNYGDPPGQAELICGEIIERDLPRDELILSSKAGHRMWPGPYGDGASKKSLVASCEQSLKRLRVDYLDIFYLHRSDPDTPIEESLGAIDLLIRQGKVLYAGMSSWSDARHAAGQRYREAVAAVERHSFAPISAHQPEYNLLARNAETDLLAATQRSGTGVIAFTPLAGGLLTGKYLSGDIPADSRAALAWGGARTAKRLGPARIHVLRALNELAETRGQSLAQMAIAWVLRLPRVSTALIGVSDVDQLDHNVAALDNVTFAAEELARIDALTSVKISLDGPPIGP